MHLLLIDLHLKEQCLTMVHAVMSPDSKITGGGWWWLTSFLETVIPWSVLDLKSQAHKLTLCVKDAKSFITGRKKYCGDHSFRKIAFLKGGVSLEMRFLIQNKTFFFLFVLVKIISWYLVTFNTFTFVTFWHWRWPWIIKIVSDFFSVKITPTRGLDPPVKNTPKRGIIFVLICIC